MGSKSSGRKGKSGLDSLSLLARSPDLAAQWHPTKNGDLTADDVLAGTNKKCWWKCDQGPDHEWESTPANRKRGDRCPFCVGRKLSVTNSFATKYPSLATYWHPTKNGNLTAKDVLAGSNKRYRCV